MTKKLTALVAGASGLVGGECLKRLLASGAYGRVVVVTRRDLGERVRQSGLKQVIADFARLDEVREELKADHVFCALGTTIRKAGTQAKFREVDCEYPLRLARLARKAGARHFSIVSALGASSSSPFFYSRVKGEVEAGLRAMDWPSLAIFRPSMIAGERGESRPLERLGKHLFALAPATWRTVAASDIAAAMVAVAAKSPPGVTIVESRDIPARARKSR
jgi:uncharacterized protein YbjT (DUF2867 family)